MSETLELHVRRATLAPASIDKDKRTFRGVWSTFLDVRKRDHLGEYIERLPPKNARLDRLKGASILDSHRRSELRNVLGVVTDAGIASGEGWFEGQISRRPDVEPYWVDICEGVLRFFSLACTGEFETSRDPKTGERILTATEWTPVEISLVAIPADPGAVIRSKAMSVTEDTIAIAQAVKDARARDRLFRTRTRAAGLSEDVADRLIDSDLTVEHIGDKLIDELAARGHQGGPRARIIEDNSDPDLMLERAATALAARMTQHLPKAMRVEMTAECREFANRPALELGADLARARGERIDRNLTRSQLYSALQTRSHSTSDFPLLLASAANKTLLLAWAAAQPKYTLFAGKKSFSDFRPHNFLRVGDFPTPLLKNETGEIKYGTLSEAGNSARVYTYARIVKVSRELLINDDLGALSQLPTAGGRRVADVVNAIGFAQFALNSGGGPTITEPHATTGVQTAVNLWHATHGNLAGAGTAIDLTSVGAARAAMMKQTSFDGLKINIEPKYLVVSPDKLTIAEQFVATNLAPTVFSEVNPIGYKLTAIADANLTGNAWYLFADPSVAETFIYGYLEGFEGPRFETRTDFVTEGVDMKVALDFGVGAIDYRGTYKNPGA